MKRCIGFIGLILFITGISFAEKSIPLVMK